MHSGNSGCIRAKWLYSSKNVAFGQKWLFFGKSGCIRAKRDSIRAKVVVFGQIGCIW